MNNELGNIWKETVVAYFNPRFLREGLSKTQGISC
jgi:hypothetical protein